MREKSLRTQVFLGVGLLLVAGAALAQTVSGTQQIPGVQPYPGGPQPLPALTINVAGEALDSIADLSGDGLRDLIVGISASDRVEVRSGRNGALLGAMNGPTFSAFGYDVASVGDVNGDGLEDILIGAPWAGTNGLAFLYSGATYSLLTSWGPSTLGAPGSTVQYGWSVARAGQINGTGPEEVHVTGPTYSPVGAPNQGYFGLVETVNLAGGAAAVLHTILGQANWEEFGDSVTSIDDRDGDGVRELMVGATRFFGPAGTSPGTIPGLARVYSGATLTFPPGLEVLLNTYVGTGGANDTFGFAVGDALDLDLDGTGDILVGATHFSQLGTPYATVIRSGAGGTSTINGPGPACLNFGHAVSSVGGSLNADTIPEFIVGAPVRFGSCSSTGRAYVFNGRNNVLLFQLSAPGSSSTFGWDVTELGVVGGKQRYAVSDPGAGVVHIY
jgi:hypothetical protein